MNTYIYIYIYIYDTYLYEERKGEKYYYVRNFPRVYTEKTNYSYYNII